MVLGRWFFASQQDPFVPAETCFSARTMIFCQGHDPLPGSWSSCQEHHPLPRSSSSAKVIIFCHDRGPFSKKLLLLLLLLLLQLLLLQSQYYCSCCFSNHSKIMEENVRIDTSQQTSAPLCIHQRYLRQVQLVATKKHKSDL